MKKDRATTLNLTTSILTKHTRAKVPFLRDITCCFIYYQAVAVAYAAVKFINVAAKLFFNRFYYLVRFFG